MPQFSEILDRCMIEILNSHLSAYHRAEIRFSFIEDSPKHIRCHLGKAIPRSHVISSLIRNRVTNRSWRYIEDDYSSIGVINFRARDEADVAAPLATFPFRTGNRYFYNLTGVSKDHPELAAIRFVVNGVEQPIIDLWSPAAVVPPPPPGPGGALLSLVPGAVTAFNNVGQNSER